MSDSLRDQLLGLGFKVPKPESRQPTKPGQGAKPHGQRRTGKPAASGNRRGYDAGIDLGKAYAIRAQQEKQERIEAERRKQAQARQRREARAQLAQLLEGKALNDASAEHARHFEYGGKIKRVYVTPGQLQALNAGELGVVQLNGRYLLVEAAVLDRAADIFPEAVALRVDPDAPAAGDDYSDPKFQVPDDLVW